MIQLFKIYMVTHKLTKIFEFLPAARSNQEKCNWMPEILYFVEYLMVTLEGQWGEYVTSGLSWKIE